MTLKVSLVASVSSVPPSQMSIWCTFLSPIWLPVWVFALMLFCKVKWSTSSSLCNVA